MRPIERRHKQRNVGVDTLVDDLHFRIRRPLEGEGIAPVLTQVLGLSRPDVSAVVIRIPGTLQVPVQIIDRRVVSVLQRGDIGNRPDVGQGFIKVISLHSVCAGDSGRLYTQHPCAPLFCQPEVQD